MQVYIEYVLINNFIIDYLLLKATFATIGQDIKRKRLFICAFFGALLSLFYPIIEHVKLLSIAYKLLSGALIVSLSIRYFTLRKLFLTSLTFFLLTFLFGGAIIGIYAIFSIPYQTEISILLTFVPVYILYKFSFKVIKYFYHKKEILKYVYEIELKMGKNIVKTKGFMDTGNSAYDNDSPIIFCSLYLLKNLLGDNISKTKFRKITIKTINGEEKKLAVKIEQLKIYILDKSNIFNNITVCVVDSLNFDGFEVILHPFFMEEKNYAKCNEEAKKIS